MRHEDARIELSCRRNITEREAEWRRLGLV